MSKQQSPSIYFDHSALDFLEKRKVQPEFRELLANRMTVCFGIQNVQEIIASPDYVGSFVDLLRSFNASYLSINENAAGRPDEVVLEEGDPSMFIQNSQKTSSDLDLAPLYEFTAHAYGTSEKSLDEIFSDLGKMVDQSLQAVRDHHRNSELPDGLGEAERLIGQIEGTSFSDEMRRFGRDVELSAEKQMDEDPDLTDDQKPSPVDYFQRKAGIRTEVLASLKGKKNIVATIQEMESKALGLPIEECSLSVRLDQSWVKTQAHRVTVVYGWLNWIGFCRDKGIRTKRRNVNSFSADTIHASHASYCGLFLTKDSRQFDKAKAAYEFLGIPTVVAYLDAHAGTISPAS